MTTVIFVHGTGGRKEAYALTFEHIEDQLKKRLPDIKLVPSPFSDTGNSQLV